MPIDRILRNLRALNFNELIAESLDPNQAERLNREQLEEGLGNDNRKLKPKYKGSRGNTSLSNRKYARKKASLNAKPGFGTPDLKLTGKYHASLDAIIGKNELTLISRDPKDKFLDKWEKRKGLTDPNIKKVQGTILPTLQQLFLREMMK